MTEQTPAATTTNAAADATSGQPDSAATQTTATPAAPAATALTDAAKPTDAKPEDEAKPDKPEAQAPEKYELTAPEGFTLEPETTAQFETVARELNLTNDQANKLVPLAAQLVQRNAALQQEQHAQQVQKWLEDAKTDKDMGGDKFDATVTTAKKAVERFATPPLKQLLDQTGLGNHPEVIRLFHRIGAAIAEDKFVNVPSGGGTTRSAANVLFDHPTSQTQR